MRWLNKIVSFFTGIKYPNSLTREYTNDKKEHPFAKKVKKVSYAIIKLFNYRSTDNFQKPDIDFDEITRAYNTDSYVRQAIDKYIELMFKAGWEFVHKNKKVKKYLKQRITMISDAMQEPFEEFVKKMAEDLIKYHNVIIYKNRKPPQRHSGMPGVSVGRVGNKNPVIAYERLPVETISVKIDKHGNIKKYKQETIHGEKEFKSENIIHIKYKQPAGKLFGVPFLIPVLDDIKLLRQIEDNVAKLLYRHLHPLFLYHVGKDEEGKEATDSEIEEAWYHIENMPTDGGLVLPERHDIDVLSEGTGLDVEKFLGYFEKRSFTGMGVSETVMGRSATANKSTADNQEKEMRNKVQAFMSTLENHINFSIVRELLLEGGFNPILKEEENSRFRFKEIDTDLLIKEENQAVYKFEHDAITHNEMREELGMEPLDDFSLIRSVLFKGEKGSVEDTDNRNDPKNQHTESNNDDLIVLQDIIGLTYNGIEGKFEDYKNIFKNSIEKHYNYLNREEKNYHTSLINTTNLLLNKVEMYTKIYTLNLVEEFSSIEEMDINEIESYIKEKNKLLKENIIKKIDSLFESKPEKLEAELSSTLYLIEKALKTYMKTSLNKTYNFIKNKKSDKEFQQISAVV